MINVLYRRCSLRIPSYLTGTAEPHIADIIGLNGPYAYYLKEDCNDVNRTCSQKSLRLLLKILP